MHYDTVKRNVTMRKKPFVVNVVVGPTKISYRSNLRREREMRTCETSVFVSRSSVEIADGWPPRRGNAAPATRQELYHCLAIVCATERRLAEPDRTFRRDDVVSRRTEPAARRE